MSEHDRVVERMRPVVGRRLDRRGFLKLSGGALAASGLHLPGRSVRAQEPVELTLWHNQNQPDAEAAFQALIDAFQAANPGITVTQQIFNWVDVKPKVLAALSAGTPPNILHVSPDYLVTLMETGQVQPVDDIVQPINERYRFLESQITPWQYDGKAHAVPAFGLVQMLYYRTDLLEAAELQPPKTWDDLLYVAQALTKDGAYGMGLPLSNSMYTDQALYNFILTNGGDLYDAEGNITFDSPEVIGALEMMQKLAPYTPPDSTNWVWEDANNALVQGTIAMLFQFGHMPAWWDSQNPDKQGVLGAVPPPVSPTGEPGAIAYSNGFSVFAEGAQRDAVKKFFDFMADTPTNARFLSSMSPGLLLPVLEATMTGPDYFAAEGIKKYEAIVRAELEAFKTGKLFGFTHGNPPASVGPISTANLMGAAVQKMILEKMSPAEAAAWGQAEMEKVANE